MLQRKAMTEKSTGWDFPVTPDSETSYPLRVCTKLESEKHVRFGQLIRIFEATKEGGSLGNTEKESYALVPKLLFSRKWDGGSGSVEEIEKQTNFGIIALYMYSGRLCDPTQHQHDVIADGHHNCYELYSENGKPKPIGYTLATHQREGPLMLVKLEFDIFALKKMAEKHQALVWADDENVLKEHDRKQEQLHRQYTVDVKQVQKVVNNPSVAKRPFGSSQLGVQSPMM